MNYKEILLSYPEVEHFQHKDKDKIIDFIILLYRKDSPLIQAYPDLNLRKIAAAKQVNIDPEKEWAKDIFELKNDAVLVIIDIFLQKILCNYTFERMISDMEVFCEYQRAMRRAVPDFDVDPDKQLKAVEIKSKLSEQSKKLEENIKACMMELYGTDEDLKNVSIKKARITVEAMAKK